MASNFDWTGPDDPEDPHNWSSRKKAYHTGIAALYAFTTTFMSSIYTSGTAEVATHFHVSTTVSLLGLSLYCLGIAFGPVLAAPLSETVGRSLVYRLSLPLTAIFTIGAAVGTNIATLVICRFFAGFFASPSLSIGAGTIADMFYPEQRLLAMSLFLIAPFIGPAIGPVIGGFVENRKGFRWLEWTMLFFLAATYAYSAFSSETYKPIILARRRKRAGVPGPSKAAGSSGTVSYFMTVTVLRPMKMLFVEPIVAFFSLYIAVNFGILFSFFACFPLVYTRVYSFSGEQVGLTFLPILVGSILATATALACEELLYKAQVRQLQVDAEKPGIPGAVLPKYVAPEHRLYAAMIGSFGISVGLFWFAWTARPGVHWASPVVATMVFAWGNLCVFSSAIMYIIDSYGPMYGASALAANAFLRYIFAGAFPLFTVQMYDRLGIDWATSLLGFMSIALLPIPWVLFKWGPQIRQKSSLKITER